MGGHGELQCEPGTVQPVVLPEEYTLDNYIQLFTDTHILNFPKMFMHTFIIAVISCLINVFFVLCVAFSMSRLRFRFRKSFMNVVLVLGMFPNIMSVVVIYFILKSLGLTQGIGVTVALILGLLRRRRRGLLRDEGLHGHHPDVPGRGRRA